MTQKLEFGTKIIQGITVIADCNKCAKAFRSFENARYAAKKYGGEVWQSPFSRRIYVKVA